MFNATIKREFIDYRLEENNVPFSSKYLDNWFSKSEEYENNFNKDLCNFTKEEILNFYIGINTSSFLTLRTLNSQLKIYTYWCMDKKYSNENTNHFEEIEKQDLFNCIDKETKTKSIITREELEKWCDYDIRNFRDQFIFLCLFEGIKGKDYTEIINLSYKDLIKEVDKDNNKKYKAHISGEFERTIEISEKLYYTALSAYECDTYTTLGESGRVIKLKEDEQRIFKGFMNQDMVTTSDRQKGKVLYTIVKRNLDDISGCSDKELGVSIKSKMSPSTIQLSGMIHFVKTNANKNNLTPVQYISNEKFRHEIEHQFGVNVSKTYFLDRNKDLLN